MKLVIVTILLTFASNEIYGISVGDYGENNEYQGGELQSNGYENNQNFGNTDYNAQGPVNYQLNNVAEHQALTSEADLVQQGVAEGGSDHVPQWQGGFQASQGLVEGDQGHEALAAASLSSDVGEYSEDNANLAENNHDDQSPNWDHNGQVLGGADYGNHQDYSDLKPKVEYEHHHIPTKTIERTEVQHIPVVKKIGVPVPHPVGVPTPQVIKVPVPQPYAVHVPVPHPIAVPIYKLVPQEIEKKVPIEVEKLVPVYVDKPFKVEIEKHHVEYVDKPYPVHIPIYKHIYHHVPKHGGKH